MGIHCAGMTGYSDGWTDSKGCNPYLPLNPTYLFEPGLCERIPTNRSFEPMDRICQIHAPVDPPAYNLYR